MFEKSLRKLWCWVSRYLGRFSRQRRTHKGGNILEISEWTPEKMTGRNCVRGERGTNAVSKKAQKRKSHHEGH